MQKTISRFTLLQNKNTVGLSEAARAKRKHRNVVTMKFNLLNYLLETVSMVLTLAVRSYLVGLLQILVTSCGTPLVYYLGMEDNRQDADTIINIIYINKHISNCKERKPGSTSGPVSRCSRGGATRWLLYLLRMTKILPNKTLNIL